MWTVMSVDPAVYNERLAGRAGNEAIVYECDRVIERGCEGVRV